MKNIKFIISLLVFITFNSGAQSQVNTQSEEEKNCGFIATQAQIEKLEKNTEYQKIKNEGYDCIVSIGVNEDSKERAQALFDIGARMFVVDIAHGHSIMMKESVKWLKNQWKDEIFLIFIILYRNTMFVFSIQFKKVNHDKTVWN